MDDDLSSLRKIPLFKKVVLPRERRVHLHGTVVSAGHERVTSTSYSLDSRTRGERPFAVLQMTLEGRGEFRRGPDRYRLGPGSLMIAPVPGNNRYRLPAGSRSWEFLYAVVAGSEFLRLIDKIIEIYGPVLSREDAPTLPRLFSEIPLLVQRGSPQNEFRLSSAAYAFLMEILSERCFSGRNENGGNRNRYVVHAEKYCRENLEGPISIDDMAGAAGISRSHLSRLFRETTGGTLKDYIKSLRFEKAAGLLLSSSKGVGEIGRECGFSDANYFCRAFREYFGSSPGRYRNRAFHLSG